MTCDSETGKTPKKERNATMKKTETTTEKATNFTCNECGLTYANKEWAEKCETWCREHHTCNLDIIRHAIAPK